MTDEKINACIAAFCGWTNIDPQHRSGRAPDREWLGNEFLPQYTHDLNAMHEAENQMSREDQRTMHVYLVHVLEREKQFVPGWRATARQRAEAFVRTISKWEDA
jgi:hypothetical protein